MKKQGKRYKAIKNQIPEEKQEISNALKICKETANAKFDESIDVVFSLNLDTKDPEQNIRTTVSLHGYLNSSGSSKVNFPISLRFNLFQFVLNLSGQLIAYKIGSFISGQPN